MDGHNTNIVVVGFIVRGDKIFIAKRAADKATFPDRFELPGGHLDPGETLDEALRREIQEEISLNVRVGTLIDAFTFESEDMFKVELLYLCYPIGEADEPVLNPADHSKFLWITEDEIGKFEKDDEEAAGLRKAFKYIKGEKI